MGPHELLAMSGLIVNVELQALQVPGLDNNVLQQFGEHVWWNARRVGWAFDPQYDGGIESITIDARYANIANTNIIRGRPNGTTRRATNAKRTTIATAWTSGRRFNAHANYNNGSKTIF
jgi:hypothetical protein